MLTTQEDERHLAAMLRSATDPETARQIAHQMIEANRKALDTRNRLRATQREAEQWCVVNQEVVPEPALVDVYDAAGLYRTETRCPVDGCGHLPRECMGCRQWVGPLRRALHLLASIQWGSYDGVSVPDLPRDLYAHITDVLLDTPDTLWNREEE